MEEKDNVYINLHKVPLSSEIEERKNKRKHTFRKVLLCTVLVVVSFVCGLFVNNLLHPTLNGDPSNTFGEIEAMLTSKWLYNDDPNLKTELEDKAFYGMTDFEDDPYTTYMSKSEIEEFASYINMNYVGIGVSYSIQEELAVVQTVFANSPAQNAGIKAGDIINKVDDVDIKGMSTSEIKQRVIGEKGSVVKISVIRDNKQIDFDVIRGEVDNSVYCHTENDYVIMNLYSFGDNTANEAISYLDQYTDYEKIIIDIRSDGGGYQTSVSKLAGLFVGNNKVYLKQSNNKNETSDAYTDASKTYDNFKKVVILVNENTASAAEVFTACLKYYLDDCTIVGTTTYGKGVIQSTHYLANGGALKYTSYNWYTPDGTSINSVGIAPDIEVKQDDVYYETYLTMDENQVYEYDNVSEIVRLSQVCLRYLDYNVDRIDGYFDASTISALNSFEKDYSLEINNCINKQIYEKLISVSVSKLSAGYKDHQMDKAIEIISQ